MNRESRRAMIKVMGHAIGFLDATIRSENAPDEIKLQAASALVEGLGSAWLGGEYNAKASVDKRRNSASSSARE